MINIAPIKLCTIRLTFLVVISGFNILIVVNILHSLCNKQKDLKFNKVENGYALF